MQPPRVARSVQRSWCDSAIDAARSSSSEPDPLRIRCPISAWVSIRTSLTVVERRRGLSNTWSGIPILPMSCSGLAMRIDSAKSRRGRAAARDQVAVERDPLDVSARSRRRGVRPPRTAGSPSPPASVEGGLRRRQPRHRVEQLFLRSPPPSSSLLQRRVSSERSTASEASCAKRETSASSAVVKRAAFVHVREADDAHRAAARHERNAEDGRGHRRRRANAGVPPTCVVVLDLGRSVRKTSPATPSSGRSSSRRAVRMVPARSAGRGAPPARRSRRRTRTSLRPARPHARRCARAPARGSSCSDSASAAAWRDSTPRPTGRTLLVLAACCGVRHTDLS